MNDKQPKPLDGYPENYDTRYHIFGDRPEHDGSSTRVLINARNLEAGRHRRVVPSEASSSPYWTLEIRGELFTAEELRELAGGIDEANENEPGPRI